MLTKIVIDRAASFNAKASIETNKKINLVYGLNGTGKSTICRLLRDPKHPDHSHCEVHGMTGAKIFVFNEEFVRENFYESDHIRGIFSLSKENKQAEQKISESTEIRRGLLEKRTLSQSAFESKVEQLKREIANTMDSVFDIKRTYSGGDRVLEFCLEGVMGKKEKLYERLKQMGKPSEKPLDTIMQLQSEARLLEGSAASPEDKVPLLEFDMGQIEGDQIFGKAVVGSHNSSFSDFINNLKSSDWVKRGLEFIDSGKSRPITCPFCQEPTVDDLVLAELHSYFDKAYEADLHHIQTLKTKYEQQALLLPSMDGYKNCRFYDDNLADLHGNIEAQIQANLLLIQKKIDSPSTQLVLNKTEEAIEKFNLVVTRINELVSAHNIKISDLDGARKEIKRRFWSLMRWEYDQSVVFNDGLVLQERGARQVHQEEDDGLNVLIKEQDQIIAEARKETVNIDEAITRINSELLNIGILDFSIKKYGDNLYQLQRLGGTGSGFKTLSEGEKMIISLLYFCELCAGNESPDEGIFDRIAVLDDPISSMSHIFVFNVGRLIISRFFRADHIAQVFVLTHSLYFFYELADTDHKRRAESQALFRVTKSANGSEISLMKYDEIQNDYQSYWQIINDHNQQPALIANCMRNVIEYFFGFVEKKDFNNVFQKPELKENKYQAFSRYMNRESHSFGQNVFDLKEFDYQIFKDGLGLIFSVSGYPEHYKQMAKIP